ncbi:uncharacterized protein LAESUDRAFT_726404 [Laetiporus sulphureus 93-53]|uniref:Uncharacterized protein n=1 Tax=Laetiporus sulphureus 93-53 TaxID=1314785 RepID=A0A165DXJ3_9APHY|nr:uncharacterized protein LAESUDRAFT_726404 [Laetiporus sulphureus 93-53]KZT05828.1 hypothetical protein LAESUDRAFT_726404 [Laetiporus sulphureus 93-53]
MQCLYVTAVFDMSKTRSCMSAAEARQRPAKARSVYIAGILLQGLPLAHAHAAHDHFDQGPENFLKCVKASLSRSVSARWTSDEKLLYEELLGHLCNVGYHFTNSICSATRSGPLETVRSAAAH